MAIFIDYRYRIAGEADIKRSMASIADYSEKLGQRVARTQDRQRRGISGGGAANSNSSTREAEAYVRAQERAAQKAEQAKTVPRSERLTRLSASMSGPRKRRLVPPRKKPVSALASRNAGPARIGS